MTKCLLLVGLSNTISTIFETEFRDRNCQILKFTNSKEALDCAMEFPVIAIVTSYESLGISSIEFCKEIRAKVDDAIPVFLFTSRTELVEPQRLAESPFTEVYLSEQLPLLQLHVSKIIQDEVEQDSEKVTVLVVEDDETQRQVLTSILTYQGYSVVCAKSYEQAKAAFESNSIDLIILDVILEGGISGVSFISYVRGAPSCKSSIPILAMSAFDEQTRAIEVFRMGGNDFTQKPFSIEVLLARVKNLIHLKKTQDKIFEQERELRFLAMHDPLTGLKNRRYFMEASERIILESRRQKYPVSLMVLDIDFFKKINDQYGHSVGDSVLKSVSETIAKFCRSSDICARIGGEEFTILCPYCTADDALKKSEELLQAVRDTITQAGSVTLSIGVSGIDISEQDVTFSQLFSRADEALYDAKGAGRNQAKIYSP